MVRRNGGGRPLFDLGPFSPLFPQGESGTYPAISCSYGQMDLVMFPKPHAFYYRTAWASLFPPAGAGRPAIASFNVSRVLDLPGQFISLANGSFQVNTMSSSAYMELYADGVSQGVHAWPPATPLTWTLAPCQPSNASACNLPLVADTQCHGLTSLEFNQVARDLDPTRPQGANGKGR